MLKGFDKTADCAVALLIHYIFDLGGYCANELVELWSHKYPVNWTRLAVIEALYQGRYKAISVEQILAFWQRRGFAMPHFNHEFERLVCDKIPQTLSEQTNKPNYPLVLKSAPYLRNKYNNSSAITIEGTERQAAVQIVDIPANNEPAPKQLIAASPRTSHQTSNEDKKTRGRSLPLALPNSVNQQPIKQFHPDKTNASDFYTKLKAMSEHTKN